MNTPNNQAIRNLLLRLKDKFSVLQNLAQDELEAQHTEHQGPHSEKSSKPTPWRIKNIIRQWEQSIRWSLDPAYPLLNLYLALIYKTKS